MAESKPLRTFFMGTPEIACAPLEKLISMPEVEVVAVICQPDKPKGRDLKLQPPPVKELALKHNLPILQPLKARDFNFQEHLKSFNPDVGIVMAYGQILPQSLLEIPKFGCLNLHTSILPKYRGAAPIQYALLNGDTETGVTIMKMDAGLDTGPIVSVAKVPIDLQDTAQTLHDKLATTGAELLAKTLIPYTRGELSPQPQPEGSTYAPRIKKEEGLINWNEPAATILNKLRAFTPWPGVYTKLNGKFLKIHRAEVIPGNANPGVVADNLVIGTAKDLLRILELQMEGAKRLTSQQFLAGHKLEPGIKLG